MTLGIGSTSKDLDVCTPRSPLMATREHRCLVVRIRISTLEELSSAHQGIVAMASPWAGQQSSQHRLEGRIVFAIVKLRRRTLQCFKNNHLALALHIQLLYILLREHVVRVEEEQGHTPTSFLVASLPWPWCAVNVSDVCVEVQVMQERAPCATNRHARSWCS